MRPSDSSMFSCTPIANRTPDDRELFIREIVDNARCIAEITGRKPSHFSYPSGVTFPVFLPWLAEYGVESATTCLPGLAPEPLPTHFCCPVIWTAAALRGSISRAG